MLWLLNPGENPTTSSSQLLCLLDPEETPHNRAAKSIKIKHSKQQKNPEETPDIILCLLDSEETPLEHHISLSVSFSSWGGGF